MRRYGLMWLGLALTALARLEAAWNRPDDVLAGAIESAPIEEHFALRLSTPLDPGLSAPAGRRPVSYVGACTWTRTVVDGKSTLQLDLELPLEDTRVLQVEEVAAGERTLVWRELRAAGGRTIRFAAGPARTEAVEWPVTGTKRRVEWAVGGALGWLELAELARADRAPEAALWMDPLGRELVPVEIEVERSPGEAGGADGRTYTLRGAGGDRVAELRFAGDRWLSFAWQGGGLVAEPVSAEAHERLLADRRRDAGRLARSE